MKKTLFLNREPWGEVTRIRKRFSSPSQPTKNDVRYYKKYLLRAIKGKLNPNVCVLGATPELRAIALDLGCKVTTVDFSLPATLSLTNELEDKDRENETIIIDDWLKVPLREGFFDVVLGDASLNNVGLESNELLLRKICSWLTTDGYFITKNLIFLPDRKLKSVKYYAKKPYHWFDLYYELRFYSEISSHCYSRKTGISRWLPFFVKLEKHKDELPKAVYEKIAQQKSNIVHSMLSKKEFEELIRKYFKVVPTNYKSRYIYSKYFPFYFLRVKKW